MSKVGIFWLFITSSSSAFVSVFFAAYIGVAIKHASERSGMAFTSLICSKSNSSRHGAKPAAGEATMDAVAAPSSGQNFPKKSVMSKNMVSFSPPGVVYSIRS